jgi:hypothetical protein
MAIIDLLVSIFVVGGGAVFFAAWSQRERIKALMAAREMTAAANADNDADSAAQAPARRWQNAMETTRASLARAQEESSVTARLSALDTAVVQVGLAQSRAATELQKEAATALEETVRGAWRQAQSEWHIAQATTILRRALDSGDEISRRAAMENFLEERAKARSFGASSSQLQRLDAEAETVAAALDFPLNLSLPRDDAPAATTTYSSSSSSDATRQE